METTNFSICFIVSHGSEVPNMEIDYKIIVQKNIKELMKTYHITMEDLAREMNYESKSTISKHLSDKSDALNSLQVIGKYADVFNVKILDLLKERTMNAIKYPVPDSRMEERFWSIFFETIKNYIAYEVKEKKLEEIGLNSDEFFEDLHEGMENVTYLCFGCEPVEKPKMPDTLDAEAEWKNVSIEELEQTEMYLLFDGNYWHPDAIYDIVSENVKKSVEELLNDEDSELAEITYKCAKDIYLDLYDKRPYWERK